MIFNLIDGEDQIKELEKQVSDLKEAAQIFHDFGDFSHLHRKYDLKQIEKAKNILKRFNEE